MFIHRFKLLLWSLSIVLFVSACEEPIGNVEYVDPPVVPGARTLVISVVDGAGNPLTGFNLQVAGPVSGSVSASSASTFELNNLLAGEYTITASRDGYLQSVVRRSFTMPEDVGTSVTFSAGVVLNRRAPAQTISASVPNTVQTAPDEGTNAPTMTVVIPANAFPESARDANGNVNFGVTRARPSADGAQLQAGRSALNRFEFEPAGVVLNEPISIRTTMLVPAGLTDYDGFFEFVDAQGTVSPVEVVGTPKMVSKTDDSGAEIMYFELNVIVNVLATYAGNMAGRTTHDIFSSESSERVIQRFACGATAPASAFRYDNRRQTLSIQDEILLGVYTGFSPTNVIRLPFAQVNGVPGKAITIYGRHVINRYVVYASSRVIMDVTDEFYTPVFFRYTFTNCHNSGGN